MGNTLLFRDEMCCKGKLIPITASNAVLTDTEYDCYHLLPDKSTAVTKDNLTSALLKDGSPLYKNHAEGFNNYFNDKLSSYFLSSPSNETLLISTYIKQYNPRYWEVLVAYATVEETTSTPDAVEVTVYVLNLTKGIEESPKGPFILDTSQHQYFSGSRIRIQPILVPQVSDPSGSEAVLLYLSNNRFQELLYHVRDTSPTPEVFQIETVVNDFSSPDYTYLTPARFLDVFYDLKYDGVFTDAYNKVTIYGMFTRIRNNVVGASYGSTAGEGIMAITIGESYQSTQNTYFVSSPDTALGNYSGTFLGNLIPSVLVPDSTVPSYPKDSFVLTNTQSLYFGGSASGDIIVGTSDNDYTKQYLRSAPPVSFGTMIAGKYNGDYFLFVVGGVPSYLNIVYNSDNSSFSTELEEEIQSYIYSYDYKRKVWRQAIPLPGIRPGWILPQVMLLPNKTEILVSRRVGHSRNPFSTASKTPGPIIDVFSFSIKDILYSARIDIVAPLKKDFK